MSKRAVKRQQAGCRRHGVTVKGERAIGSMESGASIGRDTGGGRDTDVCGPIFVERLKRVGINVIADQN